MCEATSSSSNRAALMMVAETTCGGIIHSVLHYPFTIMSTSVRGEIDIVVVGGEIVDSMM